MNRENRCDRLISFKNQVIITNTLVGSSHKARPTPQLVRSTQVNMHRHDTRPSTSSSSSSSSSTARVHPEPNNDALHCLIYLLFSVLSKSEHTTNQLFHTCNKIAAVIIMSEKSYPTIRCKIAYQIVYLFFV